MLTFLLSGLWDGASWNYVFWGAYHGLLLVGSRLATKFLRKPRVLIDLLLAGILLFRSPASLDFIYFQS